MRAIRTAVVLAASVLILAKAGFGEDSDTKKSPASSGNFSTEGLSQLRYKSLSLGGAEIRLGMGSNDFLTAIAKANLLQMRMVTGVLGVDQYNVAGTNSLGKVERKGTVFLREGAVVCIQRVVALFHDDDRGTDFARRLVESLQTVQSEKGTERIDCPNGALVLGDIHELEFDVVPGNKQIRCSCMGGKFRADGEEKDSFARPEAEITEIIFCCDPKFGTIR